MLCFEESNSGIPQLLPRCCRSWTLCQGYLLPSVPPCPSRSIPAGSPQFPLAAASLQSSQAWPGHGRWDVGAVKNEFGRQKEAKVAT